MKPKYFLNVSFNTKVVKKLSEPVMPTYFESLMSNVHHPDVTISVSLPLVIVCVKAFSISI